jgi:signal recognition particle GTPase
LQAAEFVSRVRAEAKRTATLAGQDVRALLRRFLEETLTGAAAPLNLDGAPSVILLLGVNGAGKTTSTGKLAAWLGASGKSVLLAAADTFRAAAVEQLEAWGRRAGAGLRRHRPHLLAGVRVSVNQVRDARPVCVGQMHLKRVIFQSGDKRDTMQKCAPGMQA